MQETDEFLLLRKSAESGKLLFLNSFECPFAQRTWIALNAKGVPYEKLEINLRDEKNDQYAPDKKPAWFLKLNPLGKVPVLASVREDTIVSVYESTICNEFLEEFSSTVPLLPPNPWTRASARIIIDKFNSNFVPNFYRVLLRQDKSEQEAASIAVCSEMVWLEQQFDPLGPYFLGAAVSLVDCALLPFFLRVEPVLGHYRGLHLPQECQKLREWLQVASKLPAVVATMHSPEQDMGYEEYLTHVYTRYANGTALSTSAADHR